MNTEITNNDPEVAATARRLRRRPLRHLNGWRDGLNISFEYFPPRSDQAREQLDQTAAILDRFGPVFSSVTFGAGGNVETRSFAALRQLQKISARPLAAHLTWLDIPRDEVDMLAERIALLGINHIVALRGDRVPGAIPLTHPESYGSTVEFIAGLRRLFNFEISVAGYPETHPEAASPEQDIQYLKEKVDAGASRVLCQFCFDSDRFLRFRDRAVRAGIHVPIVPGILPVHDFDQVNRFADKCGASIPRNIQQLFEQLPDNKAVFDVVSATVAAEHCTRLIDNGVTDLHFYTLNRYDLVRAVCHILGIRELRESALPASEAQARGNAA